LEFIYSLLGIAFTVLPFLIMFALGLGIPALAVLVYSRFWAGLILIFGTFLAEVLYMGLGALNFGFSLFFTDITLGLVGFAAVIRALVVKEFPLRHRAWLLFCAVFCVNLMIGLATYGSTAGVQARPSFYVIVSVLYVMSFPMDGPRLRQVFNALSWTGIILVILTVYRWVVYYLPITSLLPDEGSYNIDGPMRVIASSSALVIAEVLVAGLLYSGVARGFAIAKYLGAVLFGVTLALQHRSVWLAALAGVLMRLMLGRSKSGSLASQMLLLAGIVFVTALPMLFSDKMSGVSEQVGKSADRVLKGESTTGARLDNWKATIDLWAHAGIKTILLGHSFGADTTRYVDNGASGSLKINFAAHNLYVETLTSFGAIGLLAFLAANWYVVGGLYRIHRDGRGGVEAEVLLVLMVMQLAYYVAYGANFLQSVLFGVALSYVAGFKVISSSMTSPAQPKRARLA
jgi:hypothetical protein